MQAKSRMKLEIYLTSLLWYSWKLIWIPMFQEDVSKNYEWKIIILSNIFEHNLISHRRKLEIYQNMLKRTADAHNKDQWHGTYRLALKCINWSQNVGFTVSFT